MKCLILALVCSTIGGCGLILPPKPTFPTAPLSLLEPCDDLEKIPETTELSQLSDTVVDNYAKYHICKGKNTAWIDWYWEQKANMERIK